MLPTCEYDFVWLLEDDVQYIGDVGEFFGAYAADTISDYIAKLRYMPTAIGDEDHVETSVNITSGLGTPFYVFKNSHVERYSARYLAALANLAEMNTYIVSVI